MKRVPLHPNKKLETVGTASIEILFCERDSWKYLHRHNIERLEMYILYDS